MPFPSLLSTQYICICITRIQTIATAWRGHNTASNMLGPSLTADFVFPLFINSYFTGSDRHLPLKSVKQSLAIDLTSGERKERHQLPSMYAKLPDIQAHELRLYHPTPSPLHPHSPIHDISRLRELSPMSIPLVPPGTAEKAGVL